MRLFDIFKKETCDGCLRPIKGSVWKLKDKNYCEACYNRKMADVPVIPEYMSNSDKRTAIISVPISHVLQQQYWQCNVTLEFENGEWTILVQDTYARDRYNDAEASSRVKLPHAFPDMTPDELASFLNCISPAGPTFGHCFEPGRYRDVKAEEVAILLQEASCRQAKHTI